MSLFTLWLTCHENEIVEHGNRERDLSEWREVMKLSDIYPQNILFGDGKLKATFTDY